MQTLVLDRNYQPLRIRDWRREICDVLLGKLRVIRSYETRTIRTVRFEMPIPAVVVSTGEKPRRNAVRFSRDNIYLRDKGTCQYCGIKVSRKDMTYEHVIPRVQGGKTTWENITLACVSCNKKKGGRTPQEAGMRLLKAPTAPEWLPRGFTLVREYGVSHELRQILRDMQYWNLELDNDNPKK